jgi:PAS domain-containing protein
MLEALNVARDNEALVVAREGVIVSVNELASQLCGRSSTELVGKGVYSELFRSLPQPEPGSVSQMENGAEVGIGWLYRG